MNNISYEQISKKVTHPYRSEWFHIIYNRIAQYSNERPTPISDEDFEEILLELERWVNCPFVHIKRYCWSDIEEEITEYSQSGLDEALTATDCTNPNAVLVASLVDIHEGFGNCTLLTKDGLFSDKEYMLYNPNRGSDEKKLFWSTYWLAHGNKCISTADAIRLVNEDGETFLKWLTDLDAENILEKQDEFAEFIKTSKWSEWFGDVTLKY